MYDLWIRQLGPKYHDSTNRVNHNGPSPALKSDEVAYSSR
jgi:hypothetical protein